MTNNVLHYSSSPSIMLKLDLTIIIRNIFWLPSVNIGDRNLDLAIFLATKFLGHAGALDFNYLSIEGYPRV